MSIGATRAPFVHCDERLAEYAAILVNVLVGQ